MPRYYRRRYPRRIFRKKNWSSNIITSETTLTFPASQNYGAGSAICLNPVQSVSTVSQPFTVKNVKLSISAAGNTANAVQLMDNIIAALVYVPQGYTVTYATLSEHPEWFMAVKYINNPQVDATVVASANIVKPFTLSSRLARKLQTGDSVQLCLFGINKSQSDAISIRFSFMAQWWTCAN